MISISRSGYPHVFYELFFCFDGVSFSSYEVVHVDEFLYHFFPEAGIAVAVVYTGWTPSFFVEHFVVELVFNAVDAIIFLAFHHALSGVSSVFVILFGVEWVVISFFLLVLPVLFLFDSAFALFEKCFLTEYFAVVADLEIVVVKLF